MKQRQVNKHKQRLSKILEIESRPEQMEEAQALQQTMGKNLPLAIGESQEAYTHHLIGAIYTVLQTETIVNACNFAKWSCIWAAVAATVALIAAGAAWITVWLTLKGA